MKPTSGSFLIAPPAMIDSRFSKTVLLVTHNNLAGTFALCINKPTNHDISQIAIELGIPNSLKFPYSGEVRLIEDQYGCYILQNGNANTQCLLMTVGV